MQHANNVGEIFVARARVEHHMTFHGDGAIPLSNLWASLAKLRPLRGKNRTFSLSI
jgi:hypothetical protein